MIPDGRINAALDTMFVTGDKFSAHTAYSATGANEVTGGTYAKVAATFAAASGRAKAISAAASFTGLPAACTIAWIGLWDTTVATFKGMWPNGGYERSFQVDLTNNRIYCEGHGMSDTNTCVFTGATLPTNLAAGTVYYVVGTTAGDPDYFQVSATSGGAAIDITTAQPSQDARVSKIVLEVYSGAGGQHDINSFSIPG